MEVESDLRKRSLAESGSGSFPQFPRVSLAKILPLSTLSSLSKTDRDSPDHGDRFMQKYFSVKNAASFFMAIIPIEAQSTHVQIYINIRT